MSTPDDVSKWLKGQLPQMEAALEAMVLINSFTSNPEGGRKTAERVKQAFAIDGVSCETVKSEKFADHLVFSTQGKGAPVALIGHLDTVFPPGKFEGYRKDGDKRRGPGVLDMKSGLVAIAWAIRALAEAKQLSNVPPLRVVVVSDEEIGSPEGGPVIQRVCRGAQAALVFESGRANDAIVTARKGVAYFDVTFLGKPAHAGNNHADGVNALWACARFIDAAQKVTDYARGLTVNVGKVTGGQGKNTVPDSALAELDVRFQTKQDADAVQAELKRLAEEAAQSVKGASVKFEGGVVRYPMERTELSVKLLEKYAACARAEGLAADEAPRVGGGSDACTTSAMGIPSIDALGPRGTGFHTPDEYIELSTLVPRAAALARLLLSLG